MSRKLIAVALAALAFTDAALAGTAQRASLDSAGAQSPFASFLPAISGDGRVVVFRSDADLTAKDITQLPGYYARDLATGTISRLPDDLAGGLVQATRPDDASTKNKLLWRITTSGSVVTYDPSYSR